MYAVKNKNLFLCLNYFWLLYKSHSHNLPDIKLHNVTVNAKWELMAMKYLIVLPFLAGNLTHKMPKF